MKTMKEMNTTLDLRPMEDLVTRIDAQLSRPGGRVVGFIASGSGEGTSTLARAYASAVVSLLRRRVLLLCAIDEDASDPGVLPALAAGLPLDDCLQPLPGGGFTGSLGGHNAGVLWELQARTDLWQELRNRFDEIVIDLPATSVSHIGLTSAAQCDGVVVVLEAEKTRAPVVEKLIASLRAVRAPLLGTVLNKRRYYLPQRVYRWL
jgi:protein-tyrosine kinase